jgi:hypothetical protein
MCLTYALFCPVKGISSFSSIDEDGRNPAFRTSAFVAVYTLARILDPRSSPEALHA